MRFSVTAVVIATLMLVTGGLFGQQVDPSVQPVDPSVNARVQDPDKPVSALLPGGSSAWTGQPIMSQTPSAPSPRNSGSRGNPFPSLVGMSSWEASVPLISSASNADIVRPRTTQPATKSALSHKLATTLAALDLNLAKSSNIQDELVLEEIRPTQTSAALELRKLRLEAARSARSARVRITNPMRASADAATAGRWHSDQSSARALAEQQHEAVTLLHYGFNARSRPRRWHRGKVHTLGQHDW